MNVNTLNQKWDLKSRVPEILSIKYPIIQGAMSWLTDSRLVAGVSNAGGLGMLGPHAGQTTNRSSNDEVIERMRAEIRRVKVLTDKPFAALVTISENPQMIPLVTKLLLEENVPVILINVVDAIDAELFKVFKDAGRKILCRPVDATPENAREAERLGAEIVVAIGFDEGGSLPSKTIGTFSITAKIAQAVRIPVMAAGGITNIRGVRSVFARGAEGVYAGTLFLSTQESRMADNVKKMVVESTAEDLLLFRSEFSFYRSLPTPFADKLVQMDKAEANTAEINVLISSQGMGEGMVKGNLDQGYISVVNGITYINKIRSVEAVKKNVMQDFV